MKNLALAGSKKFSFMEYLIPILKGHQNQSKAEFHGSKELDLGFSRSSLLPRLMQKYPKMRKKMYL